MRRYTTLVAASVLVLGVVACSRHTRDDAAISAAVREELVEERVPGAIEVAVTYGVVTLSGSVPNAETRDKAGDVAEDVDGVDRVVNNLRTTAGDAPARPPEVPPVNPHAPSAPDMR